MATEICNNCGREFDEELVESMYDQKYAPSHYYSDLDDHFCMGCIREMIRNGIIDVSDGYSDEQEPDINHHLGMYN